MTGSKIAAGLETTASLEPQRGKNKPTGLYAGVLFSRNRTVDGTQGVGRFSISRIFLINFVVVFFIWTAEAQKEQC